MNSAAPLLKAILDSYQCNNTILLNVLNALPDGTIDAKALPDSASIATQFSHVHQVRLFWLSQAASEFAEGLSSLFQKQGDEHLPEHNPQKIEAALNASAAAVVNAVKDRIDTNGAMKGEHVTYDHPVLLLQHLLWHEGYHVGQIKLALKAAGHVWSDEQEEKTIWSLWRTESW